MALPVAIAILLSSGCAVQAQSTPNNSGQALEIAPPVLNLTANPGQTINAKLSLRDVSKTQLIVTGQINDFVASGEDGTPKILLDETEPNPYSLKNWIKSLPRLDLKPRQIENLPITISVPSNAAPGGYYGVIRFTATPPDLKDQGVSLSASLGALVLLKVNGAVKENLSIASFGVSKGGKIGTLFETAPLSFIERIKNNGNTHEEPTGQVIITDMFGKKIAAVNVNLESHNILPQSIRRFDQPLDSSVLGDRQLFGRYTAQLKITYGPNKESITATKTFWVIPYTLIGLGIVLLISSFFILRIIIRRYNRNIINKAQKKSRKK
jgi:hypothetical protein